MGYVLTTGTRDGVTVWELDPSTRKLSPKQQHQSYTHFQWSPAGTYIAMWKDLKSTISLQVLHFESGAIKLQASVEPFERIHFGGTEDNFVVLQTTNRLFVWELAKQTTGVPISIKNASADDVNPSCAIHGKDLLLYIGVDNRLRAVHLTDEFFIGREDKGATTPDTTFIIAKNVYSFAVGPPRQDPNSLVLALFERDLIGTNMASLTIAFLNISSSTVDRLVDSISLGGMAEVELSWNKIGSALLIKESAAVDQSGNSYYGTSKLYLVRASKTAQLKTIVPEGPVQLYGWSTKDRESFLVGYGQLPCQIELWNASKGKPKLDLGKERRNYLAFCNSTNSSRTVTGVLPEGVHLALIGGFGNLPGDLEIWDLAQEKIIGLAKLPWTVDIQFSPDNYYLLASTTTPRLRVDNCIRVIACNGEPIMDKAFEELYQASWRPVKDAVSRKLAPADELYKAAPRVASPIEDSGLKVKAKSGRFGNALSAALSGAPTVSMSVPRKAVKPVKKAAEPIPDIPGIVIEGPPGLPPEYINEGKAKRNR